MNAVERVKNNFDEKCSDSSKEYDRGYFICNVKKKAFDIPHVTPLTCDYKEID